MGLFFCFGSDFGVWVSEQESASVQLEKLQTNLSARLILIDGNNKELRGIVPDPKEEVITVDQRECDYQFMASIGQFIRDLTTQRTHRELLFPDDKGNIWSIVALYISSFLSNASCQVCFLPY